MQSYCFCLATRASSARATPAVTNSGLGPMGCPAAGVYGLTSLENSQYPQHRGTCCLVLPFALWLPVLTESSLCGRPGPTGSAFSSHAALNRRCCPCPFSVEALRRGVTCLRFHSSRRTEPGCEPRQPNPEPMLSTPSGADKQRFLAIAPRFEWELGQGGSAAQRVRESPVGFSKAPGVQAPLPETSVALGQGEPRLQILQTGALRVV